MNNIKLTVGIPTLPNRTRMYLEPLYAKLMNQIGNEKDIEVLAIMDNRVMSIGRKRTLLFLAAQAIELIVLQYNAILNLLSFLLQLFFYKVKQNRFLKFVNK